MTDPDLGDDAELSRRVRRESKKQERARRVMTIAAAVVIVTVESKGFNQHGQEVCYFRRRVLVWKRDAAPARLRPYDGVDVWSD